MEKTGKHAGAAAQVSGSRLPLLDLTPFPPLSKRAIPA